MNALISYVCFLLKACHQPGELKSLQSLMPVGDKIQLLVDKLQPKIKIFTRIAHTVLLNFRVTYYLT